MNYAQANEIAQIALARELKLSYYKVEDAKAMLEGLLEVLSDTDPDGPTTQMLETSVNDLDTIASDIWQTHGVSDVDCLVRD